MKIISAPHVSNKLMQLLSGSKLKWWILSDPVGSCWRTCTVSMLTGGFLLANSIQATIVLVNDMPVWRTVTVSWQRNSQDVVTDILGKKIY